MSLILGSERLLASDRLAGRRVGVVCNPASVDRDLRHIADRLAVGSRARLTAIFGPQHGFRSDVQENMIETGHARDEVRRVPV
ncbi:MAG TPA: exo-beta-N-acetylmuramidase NamZ domain-containing protein, partial [Vicinamibacterales bacterium]|nr:exo-beta-N-acetylmuramidase NamZ domain-containing protein [Vicinamibacterales bacterium]